MAIGGKREGAGRKPGSGKWGCRTTCIRVPEQFVQVIEKFAWVLLKLEKAGIRIGQFDIEEWGNGLERQALGEAIAFDGEIPE